MYASLYPSIIRQYNIAAHTQIGKVYFVQPEVCIDSTRVNNKAHLENWTPEVAFMEDIQSQNWLEVGYRWFNLSNYKTMYHEVEDIMNTQICPMYGLREYERNGLINVMIDTPNHPKYNNQALEEVMIPLSYEENKLEENYIVPDTQAWDSWREEKKSKQFVA